MKLTFRGWKREVKPHTHKVTPVAFSNGNYRVQGADAPVHWNNSRSALGRVTNLGLSGSFLIEFEFEPEELRSWLEQYAKESPADALRMMAGVQVEATIALSSGANGNEAQLQRVA
jgi:hypothetical protein